MDDVKKKKRESLSGGTYGWARGAIPAEEEVDR